MRNSRASGSFLVLALAFGVTAVCDAANEGLERPLPGGIVFPSLYSAVKNNPSGILHDNKSVVGLDWGYDFDQKTSTMSEGIVAGGNYFGGGATVSGTTAHNAFAVDNASLAAAVGMPGSFLGVSGTFEAAAATWDWDAGLTVENVGGFQLTILATSLQDFKNRGLFNVGFGWTQPRSVQLEASWGVTLLAPSQRNIFTLVGVFYSGILGLGASASVTTGASSSTALGPAMSLTVSPRVIFSVRGLYDSLLGSSVTFGGNLAF